MSQVYKCDACDKLALGFGWLSAGWMSIHCYAPFTPGERHVCSAACLLVLAAKIADEEARRVEAGRAATPRARPS